MTEPTPVFDEAAAAAKADAAEEIAAEDASDSQLRAWAKANGVEGVPAGGRLSAVWRENIILAMTKALGSDPKDEGTATATPEADSPGASATSTSTETVTEETRTEVALEKPVEVKLEQPLKPIQAEFDNPSGEYRSVWKAPDTWVTSQTFTA
jgi:hypothetical protein